MTARIRTQLAALTTIAGTLDGRIPNPWPARIRTTLDYLERHLPNALDNLATSTRDGWSTSASGGDVGGGSRSTGHRSPVEASTLGRIQFAGDNRDDRATGKPLGSVAVCDQLEALLRDAAALIGRALEEPATARTRAQSANDLLKQACNVVDRFITTELDLKKRLTCNCGNLPGWFDWGDPLCDNIAAPGRAGLCDPCALKRHSWDMQRHRDARRTATGHGAATHIDESNTPA